MENEAFVRCLKERRASNREKRLVKKIVTIGTALFVAGCAICIVSLEHTAPDPIVVSEHAEHETYIAGKELPTIPVEEPEEIWDPEDPYESEKIELALIDSGYIRTDIPLDNETQLQLRAACEEFGVEYELALAVIWRETNYRNVIGDNGDSCGYMQVQPRWHRDRMERFGVTDLMDPCGNFRVGLSLLSELIHAYGGNVEMALMAYNAGVNGANKNWFSHGIYTNTYSQAVLDKYAELKGGE